MAFQSCKNDEMAFENYTINKKKKLREETFYVEKIIRQKRDMYEKMRRVNISLNDTEDEIEKNLKEIFSYLKYADFVHKLMGKEKIVDDIKELRDNFQYKNKDLIYIVINVIKKFEFLLNKNENITLNLESQANPSLLIGLFNSFESTLIQQINDMNSISKEREQQKNEIDSEISNLQNRIKSYKEQLLELNQKLISEKALDPETNFKNKIDEARKYIDEINEEVFNIIELANKRKKLNVEFYDENFGMLKKVEEIVDDLIRQVKSIEGDNEELFKKIVNQVRIFNKIKKHKEGKIALLKLEIEKRMKYLRRQNRFLLKSRMDYPPPMILEKKSGIKVKINNKDNNPEEMLYYYNKNYY